MHIAILSRGRKKSRRQGFQRISNMHRDFDAKLRRLLRDGVAAGEFEINDERVAALAIGGMVSWAYVWYRSNGRLSVAGRLPTRCRISFYRW